MSFKIPRLSISRKLPDDKFSEDSTSTYLKSGFEEKISSSQLTNSSSLSRDEFEDSESQSQPDDSQCFWKSLRRLWNPEENLPNNERDCSRQMGDQEVKSQMLDEIILLVEEISILLKNVNLQERAKKSKPSKLSVLENRDISDFIHILSRWVKEQTENTRASESIIKNLEQSQFQVEKVIKCLSESLENRKLQVCWGINHIAKQNKEHCRNAIAKSLLHTPYRATQIKTNKRIADGFKFENTSLVQSQFSSCRPSPGSKSNVVRLTFKNTPVSDNRRRNLRSSTTCRRIMRSTTIETKTVWKPTTSQMTIQKTKNIEQTTCRNLARFFVPSSPHDNSDSLSLSSFSDI